MLCSFDLEALLLIYGTHEVSWLEYRSVNTHITKLFVCMSMQHGFQKWGPNAM
jgi:hypothetical protein